MTDSDADIDPLAQLADEFLERYRRGERPPLSDYTRRRPDLADQIRKLFRALVVLEDVRPASTPEPPGGGGPPKRLGEYRIVREIGRGGMGIVYEAQQESLGRRVALKVLPPRALADERQVHRFQREARAAARLHHTNIVPVFAVGEDDGTHYYVMQYIEGRPLDQVLVELRRLRAGADPAAHSVSGHPSAEDVARSLWRGGLRGSEARGQEPGVRSQESGDRSQGSGVAVPATVFLTPDSCSLTPELTPGASVAGSLGGPHRAYGKNVAHIGAQVAEALEYAAGQGVLHRDVKPSNLLLDIWGTVWLTDFGLAKATGTADLTDKEDLLGTLRYMPPERFEGTADVRGDVYALGLTLYEMLALRPAFDEPGRAQLARQIASAEPPRLDRLDPTLPRDLATIVHKAMAREPADRYATPAELAEDLRRFLDDRPIRARRAGLAEQAWRWCRRNPTAAALVGTALALFVLVVGGGAWVKTEAALERQEIEAALNQVDQLREEGKLREARAIIEQMGGGSIPADLGRRLRRARADLKLAYQLDALRLRGAEQRVGDLDLGELAREYEEAFRAAGLAADGDEEDLARRIGESTIQERVGDALVDWALVAFLRQDEPLRVRLLGLSRRANPGPAWRDRFRDPAAWRDRRTLQRLAREAPVAEVSSPLLMVLARLLEMEKMDAEPMLRAAQRLRPRHSWLNWELGNVLLEANRPAEAVGFYRAALVLRPESSAVHDRLALALCRQGLLEQGIEAYRRAIELDPAHRLPHRCNAARAILAAPRADGRLRRQALAWLRAELDLWAGRLDSGKAEERSGAARALGRWLRDRDLAGVRDPQALKALPAEERASWRKLWADAEALRARASRGGRRQEGG
jgi:serine/threonine protein kinase